MNFCAPQTIAAFAFDTIVPERLISAGYIFLVPELPADTGEKMAEKKITKTELVDRVYEKTGIVRKDVKTIIDLALEGIKETLAAGTVIELRGFGTFEVRRRKARRKARNPKTGEYISVTSHGIAAFRPGREIKQAVWNIASEDAENGSGAPEIPPRDEPAAAVMEQLP